MEMARPNTQEQAGVRPDGATDEDASLAVRAGKGDTAAFGALYDRHVAAVYRYVYYRVRNDADAEDLVSDVFMRALRAIPRYEPRQAFLAWLYRIARNAVIDRARRSRVQVSFEDALAHPGVDQIVEPDAGLLALSDKETVRAALARLTPLQQEVIVLRYVEGYSTQEIAALVDRREGTVRGIQFRAIEALRALIPSREALA
jgi:RNA polymerase sigma-70 factor (ECF subfamily)